MNLKCKGEKSSSTKPYIFHRTCPTCVSPLQEVVLTYAVGLKISSSYFYNHTSALTCHCLKLSFHVFPGHPLSLLPSISAWYTLLTNLSGPISSNASLHLTWLLFLFSSSPSCFNLSLISTFLSLSSILFSTIHLNALISVARFTDTSCLFRTHISLPYTMMALQWTNTCMHPLSLVLLLSSFCFQSG